MSGKAGRKRREVGEEGGMWVRAGGGEGWEEERRGGLAAEQHHPLLRSLYISLPPHPLPGCLQPLCLSLTVSIVMCY